MEIVNRLTMVLIEANGDLEEALLCVMQPGGDRGATTASLFEEHRASDGRCRASVLRIHSIERPRRNSIQQSRSQQPSVSILAVSSNDKE
jgi:hypothetical protein